MITAANKLDGGGKGWSFRIGFFEEKILLKGQIQNMTSQKVKRCFTIMIVPHSEETTFSLRLPLHITQLAVVFFVLGVAGVAALGYIYLVAAAEAQNTRELRQITRAQEAEISALTVEAQQVNQQIDDLDKLIDSVTEKLDELEDLEGINEVEPETSDTGNNRPAANPYNIYNGSNTHNSLNSINPSNSSSAYLNAKDSVLSYQNSYGNRSVSGEVLDRAADNLVILRDIVLKRSGTLDDVDTYVGTYIEQVEAKIEQVEARPSIWPARGRITSGFGTRNIPYDDGYQFHTGIDIAGSFGSSIRATAGGVVVYSGYRGSLGNLLIIDHGYGYETYYAHLNGFAVTHGEKVERGQTIGYMGKTGRTTGTHLHYEVHHDGIPVNPVHYLDKH